MDTFNETEKTAKKPGRRKGQTARFPGSAIYAREIRRSYSHVYHVLIGERTSPRILAGYTDFCRREGLTVPQAPSSSPNPEA